MNACCPTNVLSPDGMAVAASLPDGFALRPQELEDKPFLRVLFGEGRWEEMMRTPWPEALKDAFLDDQFRLQFAHYARVFPQADFLILERNGKPAGRLAVSFEAERAHVIDIAVRDRLQDRGIGSALLRGVIAAAGRRPVTLVVLVGSRAIPFYQRLGFEDCGPAEGQRRAMRRMP
ncbi:hypothetical protein GCM10007301_27330 [Azorhizobium oxalatiphilum]|uniref:N-acetyltransferase domain-containing protein n=1 Tax=Azorhizobium oxalatiphilum TaxID=980631 RepID=A0A917C0B4_9HYPH|nr:GNAT family N-acetyltransferase [Azorhizobium oxalatiphilum]GGF66185.1 hypothetical protein GCM10007301_27330 [Azorhizobium oxalatiphilum]